MVASQPISGLTVEYAEEPLGLDVQRPALSWIIEAGPDGHRQSAYRVLVASTAQLLAAEQPDVWDSGTVSSAQSTHVRYSGPPLRSAQRYHWNVRVWDTDGAELGCSAPTSWETGLLQPADWQATWIGAGVPAEPGTLLRKEFNLRTKVQAARLYVCGLGYYELYLNGQRVGDQVLDPGFTNYDKTVLYATHDVTTALAEQNALGVALGRGWYAFAPESFFLWERSPWHDETKLLLQLAVYYTDGTSQLLISDETWEYAHGPTRTDSVFGEIHDARADLPGWANLGYAGLGWQPARVVPPPRGRLRAQQHEPIRVVETVAATSMWTEQDGAVVFDMGEHLAGWAQLKANGPAGTEIGLRYGETTRDFQAIWTYADGAASVSPFSPSPDAQFQRDTYIVGGHGEQTWEPRFSYKGFRYVKMTGYPGDPGPDAVRGRRVRSDVGQTGTFTSSSPLLNRIHEISRRAILNNLHGIQTDTPLYEKAGWTGDAMLTARSAMYNFDMARFYAKWLRDFLEAQQPSGEVPPFVPSGGWGYDGGPGGTQLKFNLGPTPDFDVAYMIMPTEAFEHYGDDRLLESHYGSMRRYLDYVAGFADDQIMRCGLGDWQRPVDLIVAEPEGAAFRYDSFADGSGALPYTDPQLLDTAYYHLAARIVAETAERLSDSHNAETYLRLAGDIAEAFNARFFAADEAVYRIPGSSGYCQTSNTVAVALRLVPAGRERAVVENLVRDIEGRDGHLDTGIHGTRYLLPVLSDYGYADVAYRIATQTTYPSWGHWIENGATALFENWHLDSRSQCHHFFGSIEQWFYENLAGIKPASPGFATVVIKPQPPTGLEHVAAEVQTVRGKVASSWRRHRDGRFELEVTIPGNTTAEVHVPLSGPAAERGGAAEVSASTGMYLRSQDGYASFAVGPGSARFSCPPGGAARRSGR